MQLYFLILNIFGDNIAVLFLICCCFYDPICPIIVLLSSSGMLLNGATSIKNYYCGKIITVLSITLILLQFSHALIVNYACLKISG